MYHDYHTSMYGKTQTIIFIQDEKLFVVINCCQLQDSNLPLFTRPLSGVGGLYSVLECRCRVCISICRALQRTENTQRIQCLSHLGHTLGQT